MRFIFLGLVILIVGCQPRLPNPVAITAITAVPTHDGLALPTPNIMTQTPSANLSLCDRETLTRALTDLPPYTPSDLPFATLNNGQLTVNDRLFPIYGVNYYPRNTPYGRFLTQTERDVVDAEMDIIERSGLNTVRVFLRYDDLFICGGDGAIPNVDTFTRLDSILQAITNKGLRLIVVLNHDPDLRALYERAELPTQQTLFIVSRYADEGAILLWDIRDRGDEDYLVGNGLFSPTQVLTWLAETAFIVRQASPKHLITAGWWQDSLATEPFVDVVSFQHYGEYEPLRQTIAILRAGTDKPILLSAIGYSTNALDETTQRNLLYQSFGEISSNRLMGWVIYMAFDYPTTVTCTEPNCPAPMADINRYGIWNTSYFPKLALEAVERTIRGE